MFTIFVSMYFSALFPRRTRLAKASLPLLHIAEFSCAGTY